MYDLSKISVVKQILSKYDFQFSKSLGQNFIVNPNVCPTMAENCAKNAESGILEIGPGIGVLTVELAKRFKKVVSVEIDKSLLPILKETTSDYSNIKIINNDILKTDLKKLLENEFSDCGEVHVCANLPYYITSDIIMYILENNPGFKSLTIMLQKEAANRICATLGTRQTGAITLAVNYYGKPKILFNVGRNSFIPAPNVDSCVIKINMDESASEKIKNKKMFFKVVKAAYGQRRKNILNSLSAGLGKTKGEIQQILSNINIDFKNRAEQLSFEDFAKISNALN